MRQPIANGCSRIGNKEDEESDDDDDDSNKLNKGKLSNHKRPKILIRT